MSVPISEMTAAAMTSLTPGIWVSRSAAARNVLEAFAHLLVDLVDGLLERVSLPEV
jgi:hypothetical protein